MCYWFELGNRKAGNLGEKTTFFVRKQRPGRVVDLEGNILR
jgi:hypothetical protein